MTQLAAGMVIVSRNGRVWQVLRVRDGWATVRWLTGNRQVRSLRAATSGWRVLHRDVTLVGCAACPASARGQVDECVSPVGTVQELAAPPARPVGALLADLLDRQSR